MTCFVQEADPEERGCLRPDPNREPTMPEIFRFLDFLRTTGKTNMFGAAPYVEHYLDVDHKRAKAAVMEYMTGNASKAASTLLRGN